MKPTSSARAKPDKPRHREARRLAAQLHPPALDRRVGWRLALLLAGVTLAAFAPALWAGFVAFDDRVALVLNPLYNPPTASGLARVWTEPYKDFYVPVMWTAWAVLAAFARTPNRASPFGADWEAWPFHAFNVAAHVAAAVLAFVVLRRLTRSNRAGFFGAAVFALHPLQVESVAWVSGVKTPLSGAFALWAMWHFLRWSDLRFGPGALPARDAALDGSPSSAAPAGASGRGGPPIGGNATRGRLALHYGLGTLAFVLALLTKPTVVLLPLVIGLIEWLLRGRRVRDLVLPLGAWLALVAPVAFVTRHAQPAETVYKPDLPRRALVAVDSLAFYLHKTLQPVRLAPDYGRTPRWVVENLREPAVFLRWLVPAAVLLASVLLWRRARWVAVGAAVFLLGVVTTLGLIPFEFQLYSTVADRYTYFALLGPALVAAYAVARWPNRATAISLGAVAAVLGVLTLVQCTRWQDTFRLADHTLRIHPSSLMAHRALASELAEGGKSAEALQQCDRGLAVRPGDPVMLAYKGKLLMRFGRYDEAAEAYRGSLAGKGNLQFLYGGLGEALAQAGRTDEAIAAFTESLKHHRPSDPDAPDPAGVHQNLGILLARRQDWDGAVRHLEKALQLNNDPRLRMLLANAKATRDRAAQTRPAATAPAKPG